MEIHSSDNFVTAEISTHINSFVTQSKAMNNLPILRSWQTFRGYLKTSPYVSPPQLDRTVCSSVSVNTAVAIFTMNACGR